MKKRMKRALAMTLAAVFLLAFTPVSVSAAGTGNQPIAAGTHTSHAIKADGSLWAWGYDTTGVDQLTPEKIMENVVSVAGNGHRLAIKTDGSLWVWGSNAYGMLGLGDGAGIKQLTPVKIMENVASVAAGYDWSLAVKTDGSLWAWGRNTYGELGDGTTSDKSTPVKIMDNVVSVAGGYHHSLAIKTDGSVWTWGLNVSGALGIGTFALHMEDIHSTPIKIIDSGVVSISAGLWHSLAVKADGSLWAWGANTSGEIGDGTKTTSTPGLFGSTLAEDNGRPYPIKVMNGVMLPAGAASATPPAPAVPALTAKPTASKVLVDGENKSFDAYNINDNNYFKLRDLAYALSGTEKQFAVGYDEATRAIALTPGAAYTPDGSEMIGKGTGAKTPKPTASKIYLDGKEVTFTAYIIDGNNYFKLRDIGAAFDFGVDWDGASQTIAIDTGKGYTPE
ncbi:MAG: hypothetical protein LBT12_07845 [Oscillospiraceae bacterium]|jgi:hypothetical protein|nr:hypothetical protein [Oscillospiraceae bacterium]